MTLIRLCRASLEHEVEWAKQDPDGLTREESEARWGRFQARYNELRDQIGDLNPTTLQGLAWTMRVEFSFHGQRWAAAAMLRPRGPTRKELEETERDEWMLWYFIDRLERIAELR